MDDYLGDHNAIYGQTDELGITALEWTVRRGQIDLLRQLLNSIHDPELRKRLASSMITPASRKGSIQCLDTLLEAGAMLEITDPKFGVTGLCKAVEDQPEVFIQKLLDAGADTNGPTYWGITPLMRAAQYDRSSVLTSLLDHGASINALEDDGESAIMYAVASGSSQCTYLLIQRQADYSVRNNEGETILHNAARGGSIKVFEILAGIRMRGVDIHARATYGTARDYLRAFNKCTPELVEAFEALLLSVQVPGDASVSRRSDQGHCEYPGNTQSETEDQLLDRLMARMPGCFPK